jgi:hypothetical protein
MVIHSCSGKLIRTVDDWFKLAAPKRGELHWKDGKSAKELARVWTTGVGESAVLKLLATRPEEFSGVEIAEAVPECELELDDFGNGTNRDIVATAFDSRGGLLISVEGKEAEEFGDLVLDSRTSTNTITRIAKLRELLGMDANVKFDEFRYQLVHAIAGTLLEAQRRGLHRAVFVVHELISPRTDARAVARNASDLAAFVAALAKQDADHSERLCGPIVFSAPELSGVKLFIGKTTTHVN